MVFTSNCCIQLLQVDADTHNGFLMTGTIAAHQSVGSVTDLITPDSTMLLSSGRVISNRVDHDSITGKIH